MDDSLSELQAAIYSTLWPLISEGVKKWSKEDEPRIKAIGKTESGRPEVFLWVLETDAFRLDDLVKIQREMPNLRLVYLWSSDYPEHDGVYCLATILEKQAEEIAISETDKAHYILTRRTA